MSAEPQVARDPAPSTAIAIGASAGGVEALTNLVRDLPSDLPAAVLVALHIAPAGTSMLAQILDRAGPLLATTAVDGEPLEGGRIYVAGPDHHLIVSDARVRTTRGAKENGHRPAADPLLRSVAHEFGAGAVGVVLSGMRDDGTAGLQRIKQAGGIALVQDPEEAAFPAMPRSAATHVAVDAVLPTAELAVELRRIAERRGEEMSEHQPGPADHAEQSATRYICPDCGGALWRQESKTLVQFVCSVGHAYSPSSLDNDQASQVESAIWASARLLGDRAEFLRELAERARSHGHDPSAATFTRRAEEADESAAVLRALLEREGGVAASSEEVI